MPPGVLGPLPTIAMKIGNVPVEIEAALSTEEQAQGLMYRDSMPENHGMLFVYAKPQYMRFWMMNTKIPLSIAFIRDDGTISNIEEMKPYTGPLEPVERYVSKQACIYALEMNQGWFAKHGVRAGDSIEISVEALSRLRSTGQTK